MLFQGTKRQRIRARNVEGEVQVDFTGGLRLVEDGERIEPNELRTLTNVESLASGGVERRSGVMPFAAADSPVISEIYEYIRPAGVELYFERAGSIERLLPGVRVEATGWTIPGTGELTMKQIGSYLYMARDGGDGNWRRWDGTALTLVPNQVRQDAEDFNGTGLPDFNTFNQSGVPQGLRLEIWNGRAWVSQPRINGDQNKASIAFSFTLGAGDREGQEDFYENWVYNFDSTQGDEVQAMVPLGGKMFVFLRRSVHSLTPYLGERTTLFYDAQRFQSDVGVVGPKAFAASASAIWFYDRHEGLMSVGVDGTLTSHMAKLELLKKNLGRDLSGVALGFWDDKVYVSVPEKSSGAQPTGNTATYVYDTLLDAWSKHEVAYKGFAEFRPTLATQPDATLLAIHETVNAVVDLGHENEHSQDHFTSADNAPILGAFSTAWFDSEVPEAVKDWKSLEVVYRAKVGQEVQQTAYIDWDPYRIGGRWTQDVSSSASWDDGNLGPSSFTVVGPGVVDPLYTTNAPPVFPGYQENNVNEPALKSRPARRDETQAVGVGTSTKIAKPVKTNRICSSRSVSLEFRETASSGRWGVDRVTLFYSRKPIGV